jgi:GNAT superfamily N-acetyltransferase
MPATAHSDSESLQDDGLEPADLDDVGALVREAGWNQLAADWRVFLDLGTVYAVRNQAGRVVATAATLPYAERVAWISMVLVASGCRRRGVATRLLGRCLDDLAAQGLTPALDATPAGREVYVRLGFQPNWGFARYFAPIPRREHVASAAVDGITIRPVGDDDWPALARYDAHTFGADRSPLLSRLRGRAPETELTAWRGARLVGFALGRDGRSATQLGPVAAEDEVVAQALLRRALEGSEGAHYIDVADDKSVLREWLEAQGFAPQRHFVRMIYGRASSCGDLARTMAVAGPEFG